MAGLRNVLQIRQTQTQTLTMTPQLQQAIRLLQLSTLELRQEIQQTLESNPLLEIDESIANANVESLDEIAERESKAEEEIFDPFNDDETFHGSDIQMSALDEHGEEYNTSKLLNENNEEHDSGYSGGSYKASETNDFEHDELSQSDSDYSLSASDIDFMGATDVVQQEEFNQLRELESRLDGNQQIVESSIDPGERSTVESLDTIARYDNYSAKTRSKNPVLDDDGVYEGETRIDLKDHLTWQLDCSPLKGRDRAIAEAIIDAINDSGYLTENLESILAIVSAQYPDTTMSDVEVILKLIQHYDPLGVASRSVQECLMIQLNERAKTDDSSELKLAQIVVANFLTLLSNHDYRSLCSRLAIKEDMLKRINDIIVSLNPRPGTGVIKEQTDFVVPDVLVFKNQDGEYDVMLNPDSLPKVKLNEQYRSLACYARNEREKEFFKSNLQEANWFIQSIAKRNDTLLKVSRCIVKHQTAFLDFGENRMEPLVLNDIAREIDMHESTISRVTTEKYLYTPRGTYELKYFFSSHVSTESGGLASSTAIRAEIKAIVSTENPRRPFSDNQIACLLKEKGFCVARRTIAKYREALGIGSSSQRKRLI